MPKRPRLICRVCGREVSARSMDPDYQMPMNHADALNPGHVCPGASLLGDPVEDREELKETTCHKSD